MNSTESEPAGETVRVVIADDVEALRRLITRVLTNRGGFEIVGEAQDGDEAVALTNRFQPDLLILDLMMPKKSGVEVLREVRDSSPSTKVLVFSGIPPQGMFKGVGADGFLEKGASVAEILAEVERLVPKGR
jgi:two-component system chemotaxis response regulator CheY